MESVADTKAELERLGVPYWTTRAANPELEQVFVNLLVNAAQALPDAGGVITLTVGTTPAGEALVEVHA